MALFLSPLAPKLGVILYTLGLPNLELGCIAQGPKSVERPIKM